ncbi:carbohydrate kinase family protein [Agriterribacter sp.]|mgnify:CR=1 FL=1|uniref:carbohydrate kinase family protein n=1 Tax=Agriterribacter sp. TaxID=2821509 RepID=UPI002C1BA447|nr:carbohydrate kinase family protein [Agriterribacter sp.]HRO45891.1 carbohydrate kinase family protein [Agriterribacter sp.]HRO97492.1 carbohydrate kinase family protein [Ferruginibacter sp.]
MAEVSDRKGVIAGGNWIVDHVKLIDKFPAEQSLANILNEYSSNGGSPYNVLVDLIKLEAPFPLAAIGLLGNDSNGEHILNDCRSRGIDVRQLQMTDADATSYTIVTTVLNTGKRTFFHHRGANSLLDDKHFDFSTSNAKLFHLGYLLLMDRLDEILPDKRTRASYVLENAKAAGLLTSVDLVSEDSNRFVTIVPPALPYVDFLFLNEIEASRLSDIDLLEFQGFEDMEEKCSPVFDCVFSMGVNEWIIIHRSEGAWAAHRNGKRLFQQNLTIPQEKVVSTNGAGDALAAGVLLGLHENLGMELCLELGVAAAATSLSHVTCSEGIRSYSDCMALFEEHHAKEKII